MSFDEFHQLLLYKAKEDFELCRKEIEQPEYHEYILRELGNRTFIHREPALAARLIPLLTIEDRPLLKKIRSACSESGIFLHMHDPQQMVTLKHGKKEYNIDKKILLASSDFFARKLEGKWGDDTIILPDHFSSEAIEWVLNLLRFESVENFRNLSSEHYIEVLYLVDYLRIDDYLDSFPELFFLLAIDDENAPIFLKAAQDLNLVKFQNSIQNFIDRHSLLPEAKIYNPLDEMVLDNARLIKGFIYELTSNSIYRHPEVRLNNIAYFYPAITFLQCSDHFLYYQGISILDFKKLETLKLRAQLSYGLMESLTQMPSLKHLSLYSKEKSGEPIADIPNLETLELLNGIYFHPFFLKNLLDDAQFPHLKTLDVLSVDRGDDLWEHMLEKIQKARPQLEIKFPA